MSMEIEKIDLENKLPKNLKREPFPFKLLSVGTGFRVTDPADFGRCKTAMRRYNDKHGTRIGCAVIDNVLHVALLPEATSVPVVTGPTRQQMQAYVTTLTVGIPVTLAGPDLRHCFDDYYSWIDELNSDPTRPTFDAEETESATFTVTKLR